MIVLQMDLTETKSLMTEIGPEVVNRDKIQLRLCVSPQVRLDIVSKL